MYSDDPFDDNIGIGDFNDEDSDPASGDMSIPTDDEFDDLQDFSDLDTSALDEDDTDDDDENEDMEDDDDEEDF